MIETKNLTKTFDSFTAVDSLDLRIETGEFFGLLGPNGAGKTTTISLLSTLLLPTEGQILIDGQTLGRNRPDLKRKISVITQEYSMRQDMNMDEIMEYQGRLYFMPRKEIKVKTEELLDFCGLLPFRKRTVRKLSGGMKRKLMVCRALLTSPEILLLDEPTAGMDALSRRQMWNLLRQLNGKNLTILLTTHYMEEAAAAGHIAIIDKGKLCEFGTPQELKMRYAKDTLTLYYKQEKHTLTSDNEKIYDTIPITAKSEIRVLENSMEAIPILNQLSDQLEGFELQQGTMDDVFLAVTGKSLKGGNI